MFNLTATDIRNKLRIGSAWIRSLMGKCRDRADECIKFINNYAEQRRLESIDKYLQDLTYSEQNLRALEELLSSVGVLSENADMIVTRNSITDNIRSAFHILKFGAKALRNKELSFVVKRLESRMKGSASVPISFDLKSFVNEDKPTGDLRIQRLFLFAREQNWEQSFVLLIIEHSRLLNAYYQPVGSPLNTPQFIPPVPQS